MAKKRDIKVIFTKIGKKGSLIGAIILIWIICLAPFASAAKGGTISGTIYNSNGYPLGQAKVELYNYVDVDTSSTATSLQSNTLVETEKTWSCSIPKFIKPMGVSTPSPIYTTTSATNIKPQGLAISNFDQYGDAIETNTPPIGTAPFNPQLNDTISTNIQPSGTVGINPQSSDTTASNLIPLGSPATINSQISNTSATNISPLGTTASITPQSADTTATNIKPSGLSDPTNQGQNATAVYSAPSGAVTISANSGDATDTTIQPSGAPGSKSGTWYNGSFVLEGDDDGNGIPDEIIYWVLTDNVTSGIYNIMNLSYEDSSNFNDGNMGDQIVASGNDEGITGEEVVTLGTYRFIVNFTSDPSTESPDAWIISKEWYAGSFSIDLDGNGVIGGNEFLNYSLGDSNSDGIYDAMDLTTDDDIFGEGNLGDNLTSANNDESIGFGGTNVTHETYLFFTDFAENPNSSTTDAIIQSVEWYNSSFVIDADDDGIVDDKVYFVLSDMNSDGLYDTMDISLDTTYNQGTLDDDNVTNGDDESLTASDFLTIGSSFEFSVDFDASLTLDTDDARIKSNEWYLGTFTIDGDGNGIVEMNNVYYVLTDTNSDGIYEAMDISIGDEVYGEGTTGNSLVDFDDIDNTDDERITNPGNITLGDYYLFTVEFDGDPNIDSNDSRLTSKEWYEGTFVIDADGDSLSDNDVYLLLSDIDSDGLYEEMDISIGDEVYGEGSTGDFIVNFHASDNTNDERLTASTDITLGDYYLFTIQFDADPNVDSDDTRITSKQWYEGTFIIDADNDGIADDAVYFVLSDMNSNGTYYAMDISIEDEVYGETGGGTLSDSIVNYVDPGNNDNDERMNGIVALILGDSLVFIVYFDPNPPIDGFDALVLIYEWYHGSIMIDADDENDDGIKDDYVYYVLTDTDSNGLFDSMDISINDQVYGETEGGGLADGKVNYVIDTNNTDDERITTSSNIILGDSLLFTVEFDSNPDNADINDVRILSAEWYTGTISIDIDGDGIIDPDGVNFALMDRWSQGLYDYFMEISTDDNNYGEGNLWNQSTGIDNDEIILGDVGEFVILGTYMYHVQSYDGLNDGLDVNDGVNYDERDARITINQWFTGNALLEGNIRNAIVADSDSDGIFDEIYVDINDNGNFGDVGTDAIAIHASGTFQSGLELEYTVSYIDRAGQYFEIEPTGASVGSTASWFVGQISVPQSSGDLYDTVLSDNDGDTVFDTVDFDTDLPGDSIVDAIGLTEISDMVDFGGENYQVVNIDDSGGFVRISSYMEVVLDSTNDISLTNIFHYGEISESSINLNLNQDGDMADIYHTIVVDNVMAGVYETVFVDIDGDGFLSDEFLLGVGDVFSFSTNPPFKPHTFDIDFVASSGNYYCYKQTNHPVDTYTTSADGYYTLDAPTDGDYWIKIMNSTPSWGYATMYDTNSNDGISIVNGNAIENWDEYLIQTGNFIFGFVNNSLTSNSIEGVTVEVYDSIGNLVISTKTKMDGTYLLAVEPGAIYDLVYKSQGYYTDDGRTTGTWQDLFISTDVYSVDVLLVPDNTPPSITLDYPSEGQIVGGTFDVKAIATDDFLLENVEVSFDYGTTYFTMTHTGGNNYTFAWDTTAFPEGMHRVMVRATDHGGYTETDFNDVYVSNDGTSPTVSIVFPLNLEYVDDVVIIQVLATDNHALQYVNITLSGFEYPTAFNPNSGYYEYSIDTSTLSDGIQTLSAKAKDYGGNSATDSLTTGFYVDNNAPTLSINSPLNGELVSGSAILIEAQSEDIGVFVPTVQYKIDNGAWSTLSGSEVIGWTDTWDSTTVSNGIHTLSFRSYDDIGHEVTDSLSITVDNDNPTAAIVAPIVNEYVQGIYTFRVSASDEVKVTNVYITINGNDYITGYNSAKGYWEVEIDTTIFEDGSYGITTTVEDGVPSHTQTTTPFNFNIDNNAPSLSINSPLNGATVYGNSVSIFADSTDLGSFVPTVQYKIDSEAWIILTGSEAIGWTDSWNSNSISNGIHTITFRAYDTIGHMVIDSVSITVDNDNPTAVIVVPAMGEYVQGTCTFKVSASDDVVVTKVNITINTINYVTGYNGASGYWEIAIDTTTFQDGAYIVTATAEDGIPGHTQTTTPFNFNMDNNAPSLVINSPLNGVTVYGTTVSIEVESKDDGAFVPYVQYKIDSGAWISLSGSEALGWTDTWDSNGVSNGVHTITFRVYDDIGHIVTDSVSIIVDNDDPSAVIIMPVLNEYIQGTYIFKISASDEVVVTNVYITLNSVDYLGGYNNANGYWEVEIDTTTILDGIYDITATVEDGIPGHTQTTTPISFNIDNKVPTLSIYSPGEGETVWGTVLVDALSKDDGAFVPTVQYKIDSGVWITLSGSEALGWTDSWDTNNIFDGIHTITFRAYDGIGHVVTESILITVDNDVPIAVIAAPVMEEYVKGTYTFKVSASDDIGITNVYITIRGVDYTTGYNSANGYWELEMDTNTFEDDIYGITATVEDGIPGHTLTTPSFDFNIDNHEPSMMIYSPLDGEYVRGIVTLNVAGSDMFIDSVKYNVDGTGWILNTTYWDTTIFEDGEHTISIRAVDLAGHITQETINVIVDNQDTDRDGIGDLADQDIDGDGVDNTEDSFPYDDTEWVDTDGDGIGDNGDDDDDGDGILDVNDDFPLNSDEYWDLDDDGIGDNSDIDIDGDGVYNINDEFLYNASEWSDIDGDNIGDNSDDDMDGDGVSNVDDEFPYNTNEWRDSDNDGIGDNTDEDDDNDGVPDINDVFPLDSEEWRDTDKDGVGDNHDGDIDGDGVSNVDDEFPYNINEWKDTDFDGIGDSSDPDDDDDGIVDHEDFYPLDKSRYLEPFWWWWIIVLILIIILIIVISITRRKPHKELGNEEKYLIVPQPIPREPAERKIEEWPEEIEEPVLPRAERTKVYNENELRSMRKSELTKMAVGMGLSTAGTKVALINRILDAQFARMVEEAEKVEGGKEEEIVCPSCNMEFKVRVTDLPTVIKCPHCGTSGTID